MKPLAETQLYGFVDTGYLHGRDPVDVARQLCLGGADLIQLRAKDWPLDQVEEVGSRLLKVCEDHDVALVINDHPRIALTIGAHLAHLGQEDFFDRGYSQTSQLFDVDGILDSGLSRAGQRSEKPGIGLSTHAPEQALRAKTAGAAYLAVGPIHATPTKPGRLPVTLEYVRWAAANLRDIPWFAIGGITLSNLDAVLAAGAQRVCVVSAILTAPDIRAACREFKTRLGR